MDYNAAGCLLVVGFVGLGVGRFVVGFAVGAFYSMLNVNPEVKQMLVKGTENFAGAVCILTDVGLFVGIIVEG